MIKASELRIGNWVMNPNTKTKHKISSIDLNDMELKYKEREGILLTQEILEKCAFTKHSNSNEFWNHWVAKNGWDIGEWVHNSKVAGFEEKGVCYWVENYVAIRYVHQLQNLFFALTNEEIIYNPNIKIINNEA